MMNKNIKYGLILVLVFIGGLMAGRWWMSLGNNAGGVSVTAHADHDHTVEATIWTCSMHPQIQQPEPGICPICNMDLTPMQTESGHDPMALTMSEAAMQLANIQTTRIGGNVAHGETSGSWMINGKILPDERRIYSQAPHIGGRIESLFVTYEGMYISKGSKVADIYSPEIIAAQQEFLESLKLEDVNPRMKDAARNKLRFLKIPDFFIEQLESKRVITETFPLLADRGGYVINKKVEVGDHVDDGQILFDIYDLSSVWAVFDVYEKDLPKIKTGDVIEFTATAIPAQKFQTRIDFINPILDHETRAVKVRGQVNNGSRTLKPQMLIRGHESSSAAVQTGEIVVVPKTAVLWTGRESVVYVKDSLAHVPTFSYRQITLGHSRGDFYEVVSGLQPGEEVVTNGVFAVDASAQLNNKASMMHHLVNMEESVNAGKVQIMKVDPEVVTQGAREDLVRVLNDYITLKNELVNGESGKVLEAVRQLKTATEQLKSRKDLGEYNDQWNQHARSFTQHMDLLHKEESLEGWRHQFVSLSDVLIHWIQEFGNPQDSEIYIQHCPMANNDKGADWLSYEFEIRNPYYGEAMMKCGMTEKTL